MEIFLKKFSAKKKKKKRVVIVDVTQKIIMKMRL
jgi:hypothetical protein